VLVEAVHDLLVAEIRRLCAHLLPYGLHHLGNSRPFIVRSYNSSFNPSLPDRRGDLTWSAIGKVF
jgi:hypothetical protein